MHDPIFLLLIALVAFAYAMVGHGGASGYLALMALWGFPQDVMRPSALVLNLVVSAIAFTQFARAGHFRWRVFWPFAVASVPLAWVGSQIELDPLVYKRVLAVCLLVAVARMLGLFGRAQGPERPVPLAAALAIGGVLGLVSGMIGIGGGILLSPVLLLARWADAKVTSATSAAFIFVNSVSGLAGALGKGETVNPDMWPFIGVAVAGGLLGGWIGAARLPELRLRQVLGVVLLFASVKLWWP
ncbi:MAG TPA: sulfite exporter TauE/SafE family protein [Flavobacteriales bacterium]|jgi:hypothetical protein|nr:sulfite exporter TauE/SafE family protein [Flavobacteriales bacterium]